MLRAIALVILPSFQSGLHPDDGHALQSSLDLRPQVEGPTLTTLAVFFRVLKSYPWLSLSETHCLLYVECIFQISDKIYSFVSDY